jgi:hypothetical protein
VCEDEVRESPPPKMEIGSGMLVPFNASLDVSGTPPKEDEMVSPISEPTRSIQRDQKYFSGSVDSVSRVPRVIREQE